METSTPDMKQGISVVLPAYNEAGCIAEVIQELQNHLAGLNVLYEIIVVDDGSSDGTFESAQSTGAFVHRHTDNRGYGAAVKTGVRLAQYPWILLMDADGSYPADSVGEFLAHTEVADMIVGSRTAPGAKVPRARRPMKWILRKVAEFLAGRPIPDLNSGMRLVRRDLFEESRRLLPDGFSLTTTLTLLFLSESRHIRYIPIEYHERAGSSKFRPIRDTWNMTLLLIRTVLLFNPLKIFLPLSGLLFLAAVVVAILSYTVLSRLLDTTFVVLLISSLQFLALGFLADLVNRRR
ncbi:MAG: glycosyltransferase family 2 protein [bacterium]